jgi:hypothetical protein
MRSSASSIFVKVKEHIYERKILTAFRHVGGETARLIDRLCHCEEAQAVFLDFVFRRAPVGRCTSVHKLA